MGSKAAGAQGTAPRPAARPVVLLMVREDALRDLLALHLRELGCYPLALATAAEGMRLASQLLPDLILADLDDPEIAVTDWVSSLGAAAAEAMPPLIGLSSARSADAMPDGRTVLPKPVRPRELAQYLWRLVQQPRASRSPRQRVVLRVGPIELDRHQPTVRVQRGSQWIVIDLPTTEHRLLEFLLTATDRVRSRDEIRQAVWPRSMVDLRTVDQYVRRLRRSLAAADASAIVRTVNRAGYRVQIDALAAPDCAPPAVTVS